MSQLVYPILDIDTCRKHGIDPERLPESWLDLGLSAFQLRWKKADPEDYLVLARRLKERFTGAALIANDYADLARQPLFALVHIGQEDQASELPVIQREKIRFGISTHSSVQMKSALALNPLPAYIALGPVRSTVSKPGGKDPVLSPDELERALDLYAAACASAHAESAPGLVLIGGIHAGNAEEIVAPISSRGFIPAVAVIQAAIQPGALADLLGRMQSFAGPRAGLSL